MYIKNFNCLYIDLKKFNIESHETSYFSLILEIF